MRSLMWFAALAFIGSCMTAPIGVITRDRMESIDELLRDHPLGPTTNIRADEIDRTSGASVHLVQVRGGETPHRHVAHDLTVYVLRGEGTLTLAGATHPMRAGDVAVIPRDVPHHFVRSGAGPAVALVVFAPPLYAPDTVAEGRAVDSPTGPR